MAAPDIFLSYNREDQARAKQFADAFAREGLSVWWDATLKSGEAYDEVTEKALNDAKAVVVLWSPRSVGSRWVRAEATQADRNKTLVPVMIESCKRPIMFELTHTAELSHWKGDPSDAAWLAFVSDLKHFVGKGAPVATPMPSLQTTAQPALKSRRSILIGGIAIVAVAIAAATFLFSRDPQPTTPTTQRTAFFGVTTTSTDPIATQIAATVTDETFKTLNQMGLDTVSRAETKDVAFRDQLDRARELGALYALGGEVRNDGANISVSMRFDDVVQRVTVWEETFKRGEMDNTTLAYRVTDGVAQMISCYTRNRARLRNENEKALTVLARGCKADARGDPLSRVDHFRELAVMMSDSPDIQAMSALMLVDVLSGIPSSERSIRRAEADAALARALALDPGNALARTLLARLAIADGKPFFASEKELIALVRDNPSVSHIHNGYGAFLRDVGRYRDALPYFRAADRLQPLTRGFRNNLAMNLVNAGRAQEAARLMEENYTRLHPSGPWATWMSSAVLSNVSDPEQVLKLAPADVPGDVRECWKAAIDFTSTKGQSNRQAGLERVQKCAATRIMGSLSLMAATGEVDAAFAAIDSLDLQYARRSIGSTLLAPYTRAIRSDSRFLPLMKEVGLYQYWLDSNTHPDICDLPEERDFPVCVELRKDQGK